jgi:hypothetical protein
VPILPRDEGSGTIEKILAIVKIKYGEMLPRRIVIAWRGVDD